ncbi:MAG: hypothetical protein V5A54_13375, partial [Haloarculaceae archaeon]
AETTVSKTIEAGNDYTDGSMECAREAHGAVRARLEDEFDDLSNIGTGYGQAPEGFDGMAVSVSLTTATYDRDGELIEEADRAFEEVVSVTPPTAYLKTEDGDRVCAVPVYVTKRGIHLPRYRAVARSRRSFENLRFS